MAACFCCFRCCWNGTGFNAGHVRLKELPEVKLDTTSMGNDVVIVKNGRRICGTGAALASAPLVQNKAFFEIKIQSTGVWGVGVATKKCDVQKVPLGTDTESWVLRHTGFIHHGNEQIIKLSECPQEGDIVGLTYDHIELNFYLNGKALHCPVTGIKGTFYPVLYVDEGAILDAQFSNFYHVAPEGFEQIMVEQSLL
ncbi:SPRY domain-containing protein 7-like [Tubulanus polymorphus]|uniref:SPRY domain-containing protein 7-like n=1 Tax=Tubulanus polymorphus TaxID=672921 RepID=UPI003DA59A99